MQADEKRAAIAAYKEMKKQSGIFALRCVPSGECWVGRAPDLDKVWNRMQFTLKQGTMPHRNLQAAAKAHGVEAFSFEVLEVMPEDTASDISGRLLKQRLDHWSAALGAPAL